MNENHTYMLAADLSLQILPSGTFRVQVPSYPLAIEVDTRGVSALTAFSCPERPEVVFRRLMTEGWEGSEIRQLVNGWIEAGVLLPADLQPLGRLQMYREALKKWSEKDQRGTFPIQSLFSLQKPPLFYPGLESREVHDSRRYEWVGRLEKAAPAILEELDALLERRVEFYEPYEHYTSQGKWATFQLWFYGRRIEENCDLCPKTAELLNSIPGVSEHGTAQFSVLAPQTIVASHCGTTNTKLRCQLPLRVPENCGLRVGNHLVHQAEGSAIVFDDSFVHTAWNKSRYPRFILLFDFYHPDLTSEEIEFLRGTIYSDEDIDEFIGAIKNKTSADWIWST